MTGVLRARVGGQWVDISLAGPPGPSGSAASGVTFTQAVPSAVWTIPHDLGYPPNVTVIDSSGAQVEGDAVLGSSLVTLTFSAAFAGTAYLS